MSDGGVNGYDDEEEDLFDRRMNPITGEIETPGVTGAGEGPEGPPRRFGVPGVGIGIGEGPEGERGAMKMGIPEEPAAVPGEAARKKKRRRRSLLTEEEGGTLAPGPVYRRSILGG